MKEHYDLKTQTFKRKGAESVFNNVNKYIYATFCLTIIGILVTFINFDYRDNLADVLLHIIIFLVTISFFLQSLMIVSFNKQKIEKNASLILPGEKGNYFIKVGTVVKKHFKNIRKTADKNNLLYDLYIKMEAYCTHWGVLGTTGSGKTVFVQSLMKQIMNIGGGFIFTDGKGSKTMLKTIKAICKMFNRQNDFYVLNLANPRKSNSMNVFSMEYSQLIEIFNGMIETGEGDIWEKKGTSLAAALLQFVAPLQKMGIAIDVKTINKINTYNDLKELSPTSMNFTLLDEYLNAVVMLDICKMFQRIIENENKQFDIFCEKNNIEIDERIDYFKEQKPFYSDFVNASLQEKNEYKYMPQDGLTNFMSKEGGLVKEEILSQTITSDKLYEKGKDSIDNFVQSAISYFTKLSDVFTKEYGAIFNASDYDFTFEDIILNHRILYIVMPGTKSQATINIFAKFLQANLVAVYETLKETQPLTIPFTVFFDETNSYMVNLKGMANFPSQSREQRLAFFYMMQSGQGKLDDGKNIEAEQLFSNINNYVILKTTSETLTEMMQKKFPKIKELIQKDYYRLEGKWDGGEKIDLEEKERPMFEYQDIESLAPGECYIKIADGVYTGTSTYAEAPYYYQDKGDEEIELLQGKTRTNDMYI